ncbi:hypothetical protein [Phreatobacter sp. AB_2022a]|uniref:hypothetical protein n=1 Tax=Phreatobacter sp. AB_2022a TaxID=3003134 RepID=UPI0022873912|nr:hypothetical protein [Phreatobacter sp. AB_2022a]MCZ0738454.1 hypothetical protein [Phreatobacter sp. AB_2022a]
MSHNLDLAQNHAWNLARTLMVPVTLFRASGEYGVLPTADIDDADDLEVIHEFDPWSPAR